MPESNAPASGGQQYTSVAQYVRAHFKQVAGAWFFILLMSVPAKAVILRRTFGNEDVWLPALGAIAIGFIGGLPIIWMVLSIGGWVQVNANRLPPKLRALLLKRVYD